MSLQLRHVLAFSLLSAAVGLVACASDEEGTAGAPESSYEDELINAEKNGAKSQKWIYTGPLTALEKPEIFASLKAHTVRVTGLLPANFKGQIPFYAEAKPAGTRTKLTVVYPIATGKVDPSTGSAPAAPGVYNTLFTVPYTPTNDKAPWGGFPFMLYKTSRGIAFHGPITSVTDVATGDLEWRLLRGPVSHGCNRMAGEHIVEMAQLIGVDMTKPHSVSDRSTTNLKVTISPDFDTFDGKLVDVDYPVTGAVERPKGDTVKMYRTWLSDDMPRFVCAYQADRALGPQHCETAGDNRRDVVTGKLLVDPNLAPWIGSSCKADADCAFDVGGKKAACSLGTKGSGVCTIACEGSCPDKAGYAGTFCSTLADGAGRCLSKADSLNDFCAIDDNTSSKLVDRMIGTSTAKAAKATVCMPQ